MDALLYSSINTYYEGPDLMDNRIGFMVYSLDAQCEFIIGLFAHMSITDHLLISYIGIFLYNTISNIMEIEYISSSEWITVSKSSAYIMNSSTVAFFIQNSTSTTEPY